MLTMLVLDRQHRADPADADDARCLGLDRQQLDGSQLTRLMPMMRDSWSQIANELA